MAPAAAVVVAGAAVEGEGAEAVVVAVAFKSEGMTLLGARARHRLSTLIRTDGRTAKGLCAWRRETGKISFEKVHCGLVGGAMHDATTERESTRAR